MSSMTALLCGQFPGVEHRSQTASFRLCRIQTHSHSFPAIQGSVNTNGNENEIQSGQPTGQKHVSAVYEEPRVDSCGPRDRSSASKCWGNSGWWQTRLLRGNRACVTSTYMASLTVRIPASLERELEAQSRERGISKSDVAREALERDLRVQAWRRLREQFRPHLERQGVFTEADVLKRLGDEP